MIDLRLGDCLEVMKTLESDSVDAVVTDPPAGIAFMGKSWDNPQNYPISNLGFTDGGNRRPLPTIGMSSRNGTCRKCGKRERGYKDVEPCRCPDPDFDERERRRKDRDYFIAFMTDALAECLRVAKPGSILLCWAIPRTSHWTGTAIEDAGWIIEDRIAHAFGTGFPKHKSKLKPAVEDWWLARKPGGKKWLNVDGCRIAANGESLGGGAEKQDLGTGGWDRPWRHDPEAQEAHAARVRENVAKAESLGRYPANLVLSHSPGCGGTCADDCPIRLIGGQSGEGGESKTRTLRRLKPNTGWSGGSQQTNDAGQVHADSGTAARFFPNFDADPFLYCAKASSSERGSYNTHPTVKSLELMRWLVRLATPPGGKGLDPFAGSGSTLVAAMQEGFDWIGIEHSPEYHAIATRRIVDERASSPLLYDMLEAERASKVS